MHQSTKNHQSFSENRLSSHDAHFSTSRNINPLNTSVQDSLVIPLSIKRIRKSDFNQKDRLLFIDGKRMDYLKIIARFRSFKEQPNRTILRIKDCTGALNTLLYSTSEFCSEIDPKALKFNNYYEFILMTRILRREKQFVIVKVREITDFNEITNHIQRTIVSHLHRAENYRLIGRDSKDLTD